jgi:hypothetical protein
MNILKGVGMVNEINITVHGRGEKSVQGFGGKARRKKTIWKTKA